MRRVLLTFLGLLLITALCVGWYVYDKGFTRKWRNQVTEEFRKRGFEVSLRRLTIDPFRGLVAKEVKVLDARDRRRTLAVIDEVVLQVNYQNLFRGRTFLDALDLREARLSVPVDPAKPRGARIEVSKLNARLFLPPQQLYLSRAEAEISGIQVSISGRLINPQAFRPQPPSGESSAAIVARAIEEIKALSFEGAPPVLSLSFSGDLAEPEKIVVDLALWGEQLRRQNYRIETLYLAAGLRDGVIDLKQCSVADAVGELHLQGSYQLDSRAAELHARSSLDLQSLATAFRIVPQLGEFVFYEPPTLELTAQGDFGRQPRIDLRGHLGLAKFAYKSVVFDRFDTDFSWDGERWSARDLRLVHQSGEISGDALQLPGDFRAKLKGAMNPKAFQPLISGKAREALEQFEFTVPPEIELEARGPEISRDALTVAGRFKLGAGSYRGVAAEGVTAAFRYHDRVLTFSPFEVRRSEGGGGGTLIFDFRSNEVRLEKIRASVNPVEVAMWIEPKLVKDISPYRSSARPPNLSVDGVVHTKGGKTTRLAIEIDAPGGMEYTFLKKELRFPKVSGKLLFTHERLRISEFDGVLFGGRVRAGADISLNRLKPSHTATIQLESVDFASLTKLYFNYENSKGQLAGTYDFSGRGPDARTMTGRGELKISEGNVFAIPFLGPLSGILNNVVPGMGYNVARQAAAKFTISEGVIATKDLEIQGRGFSMYGAGKLYFLDDRMDFDMRINAQGLPGVLLFPVSKLLEYTSDEKLSKPTWRPKVVPRF
ncbi:MAG TPA: AsmA-like C-terminal region-containing protein [Chthoniobacteraceae bacterium]